MDGLRLTTAWALAAALAITSLTTVCCAWRWSLVAGGLGVDVPAADSGGCLLPVAVPQLHASRRGAGRRAPGRAPRACRRRSGAGAAVGRVGACVGAGRAGVADGGRPAASAPARRLASTRGRLGGRRRRRRRAGRRTPAPEPTALSDPDRARRHQRPPRLGPLETGLAGHRARLHRRRDGPRRGVRGRGAGDRDGAAGGSAAPTGTGRAAGLGCTGEHRRLGPARGCGRVGVRRGRAERCCRASPLRWCTACSLSSPRCPVPSS